MVVEAVGGCRGLFAECAGAEALIVVEAGGSCKESVVSPISHHVISAYLLTFTPFSQRYNCVMT